MFGTNLCCMLCLGFLACLAFSFPFVINAIPHGISFVVIKGPVWLLSHPDSLSDPIGNSKPSSGCETKYWDSLPVFFFFFSDIGVSKSYDKIKISYKK